MAPIAGTAEVPRVSRVTGAIRVPGDKSISHRYAMLGALAGGVTRLHGFLPGADCLSTLACLEALGVDIVRRNGPDGVSVTITGRGAVAPAPRPLDAGNSGTTMRLLSGILAGQPFQTVIGGDASLSRRPMRRVIEPLTKMGAAIASHDGRPPLTITGGRLHAIAHTPEVPSAQVKSAVLLAGLHAEGRTTVREPAATRDHTERALEAFGARVIREGLSVSIDGLQTLSSVDATVPGDVSSAVFWMALAAGTPGSSLTITGVGLNPSRTAVIDLLRRAGALVETLEDRHAAGEPIGSIHVRCGTPRSFTITPADVPGVIDEIPALAALAVMHEGTTMTVRGAGELRVKESDRISTLAAGFRALGAEVEEYDDGFTIGGGPLAGGEADAAGDHRLAMAFAIAASRGRGTSRLAGAEAVAVSYPGFFDVLERFSRSGDAR